MKDLSKIWKARKQILEGVANSLIKKQFVEDVAKSRMAVCNACAYKGSDCEVPGTAPCCGACGCSLYLKVRSMSSVCGAIEKGEKPKWLPVLSQEDDDSLMLDNDE